MEKCNRKRLGVVSAGWKNALNFDSISRIFDLFTMKIFSFCACSCTCEHFKI